MIVTEVAPVIHAQFPEISISDVTLLGEGCDSRAFDVSRRRAFKFPKRFDVDRQFLIESRIVPVLAAQSPLPLPAFWFFWTTGERLSIPFCRLPEASGCTGDSTRFKGYAIRKMAPTMGRFLSSRKSGPMLWMTSRFCARSIALLLTTDGKLSLLPVREHWPQPG
jgi:hypothetical protein